MCFFQVLEKMELSSLHVDVICYSIRYFLLLEICSLLEIDFLDRVEMVWDNEMHSVLEAR